MQFDVSSFNEFVMATVATWAPKVVGAFAGEHRVESGHQ